MALKSQGAFGIERTFFDVEAHSQRITDICSQSDDYFTKVDCLNSEIQKLLNVEINALFQSEFSQYLDLHDLGVLAQENMNLGHLYRVSIPTVNSFNERIECFNLSTFKIRSIKAIAKGMINTSLFIKNYSVYTMGKPFSPLLGFKKVNVCSSSLFDERFMDINGNESILNLGFKISKFTTGEVKLKNPHNNSNILSAQDIWDSWFNGDVVNQELICIASGFTPKLILQKPKVKQKSFYIKTGQY